ncbi:Astacin-like metalloendopeptidase [Strongyloides ratti]|uniref:Metalloendopeptidase n=1 Tax=Strongyloides ratti TaxID=34506 RepID=A0A090MZB7_STRRB|nr:Astacin-like metalloendopeptidase [Strongyloides ratti]CEF68654.2 Astacin-like metalloendopeptidase [Strongyloides ratti]
MYSTISYFNKNLILLLFIIFINVYCDFLTNEDFYNARFILNDVPLTQRLHDMRIPKTRFKRGSVVIYDQDKWPDGRVPYQLSSQYTLRQRAVIAKAFNAYYTRTCIEFVPRNSTDIDYVYISKKDGCYADFARVGGKQEVSLADECVDYPTVIHELMHVIGFIHEHQRSDRDEYIKVIWKNIIDGANTDFEKLNSLGLSNYGETYDYFSIMHYESTEGSRNGQNTLESLIPAFTTLMGKALDFTAGDLRRVNKAYRCDDSIRFRK